MRCCAHILNLVVSDGLKVQQSSIDNIRNAVRYVRSSSQRTKRFKECIEAELINSKSLVCLDVATRWNSTYMMLEHVEKFEKAFDRLHDQETDFRKWFLEDEKGKKKAGPPVETDWQNAMIFIQFLKIFYDVTLSFSSSLHVTSHKCFHEIVSIQSELKSWSRNHFGILGSITSSMSEKFDKYWGNIEKFNPLLLVAVVLDPRYKLEYVTYCIEDMYDVDLAASMSTFVMDTLNDLYKFYSKEIADHKDNEDGDSSNSVVADDRLKRVDGLQSVTQNRVQVWKKQKKAKASSDKSDLERYLDDEIVDSDDNSDFNILDWWKSNSSKYRILSIIARDVLAIPVSTVASESCFGTSRRVLDVFRSSLSPKMTEALICAQNWLNPAGCKFDEEIDQFDSTEKIVDDVSSKIHESQRGNDTQEAMHVD
ncbi:zinc finger BED domain-containing protein RICESLEEPER 2-like [Lotus japonicus]|uniref:zinc finger BED domain-containing protein RICESLEEPER 2-like n=1 Tax=Lotus japonicus TaxID=34305 RepID=UPI002585354E|nr:zinc finger BED domain-containing protein RICESLEEPER 2-like [Lotus japonicus]